MGRILVLDEVSASQIAAGEVVERPSSVVKELVENSLDAGATRITIETRGGGAEFISVVDNGDGMDPGDAIMAFSRHATSKITSGRDLGSVTTLGFRGEALPSIVSVSRVELLTRPAGLVAGTRVLAEGGTLVSSDEAPSAPGTRVTVRGLFYNTPARRKFMLSSKGENASIADVVARLALAHPQTAFSLTQEGKEGLRTTGSGDTLEAIAEVFGRECAGRLRPFCLDEVGINIRGFLGDRNLARPSRRRQYVFIGGRPVSSGLLKRAIEEATQGQFPVGLHPFVLVALTLEAGAVDFNVHPAKAEVRFSDDRTVFRGIVRAMRPEFPAAGGHPAEGVAFPPEEAAYPPEAAATQIHLVMEERGVPFPNLEIMGQVNKTYIVASGHDGLYLVDQHAAHERITFERLRGSLKSGTARQLLIPVVAKLEPGELSAWLGNKDYLESIGITFDDFGKDTIAIRCVPEPLGEAVGASFVRGLTERLLDAVPPGESRREEDTLRALASCHASVKAGRTLSMEEMRQIIRDLSAADTPLTCPHGRPTIIKVSWDEMERRFGRRRGGMKWTDDPS